MNIHFISASAHKFHGPKGTGILYVNKNIRINPLKYGGGQERNLRAGTENVYGIVGFAKALELAMENYAQDSRHILLLKKYLREKLTADFENIYYNGDEHGLYSLLSVRFPKTNFSEMLLLNLDLCNICASGGSACSSGSSSHVLKALGHDSDSVSVRFSFSKHNTEEEMDKVSSTIAQLLKE